MFGYVTTNMEEMKIKDYRIYHGFYCGVCQDLKEDHGQTSRVTLTYDVTFLGILLTGLYETETKREEHFCAMHPTNQHLSRICCCPVKIYTCFLLTCFQLLQIGFDCSRLPRIFFL